MRLFFFSSSCILHRFNHELVFGISVKNLSKAERLIYGDSLMTHAMILTAVTDKVHSHKHAVQVCECFGTLMYTCSTYTNCPKRKNFPEFLA